jgi:hypothetical protein
MLPVLAFLCAGTSSSKAQVAVTFSQGPGNTQQFTLPAITFTVTDAAAYSNPGIINILTNQTPNWVSGVISGGNASAWSSSNTSLVFSIESGSNFYANAGNGSPWQGNVAWMGLKITGPIANGDQIYFTGGTFGGTPSYIASLTSGSYDVTLSNGGAVAFATQGAAVPEPGTYAAMIGAVSMMVVGVSRRRNKAA